jgi:CAAX protease family protein
VLGLWAVLCLAFGLYATWQGYGGPSLAATLTAFAFYFGVMLLFAGRGVPERVGARLGSGAGYVLGAAALGAYIIYLAGTDSFELTRAAVVLGFIVFALGLAAVKVRKAPGSWQDYVTLAGIWVGVKFSSSHWVTAIAPSHWLWPYPNERLAYVMTVLLCVNVALAGFVLVRKLPGVGYNIGWGRWWSFYVLAGFLAFGAIAIPLGTAMHFIEFAPRWHEWQTLPFVTVTIFFFTAWPEEFLFRGLLQNLLARSMRNERIGWWNASVLFGLSHITNLGFPNWRYVILASIAGLFYGWTWRKSGSIFASAIVHALVDATWHFLFRTL